MSLVTTISHHLPRRHENDIPVYPNDIILSGFYQTFCDTVEMRCFTRLLGISNLVTVHNKVISGFQALRRARAPVAGLEPATERSCRSQGGLAIHCATDAPPELGNGGSSGEAVGYKVRGSNPIRAKSIFHCSFVSTNH
ncbi:hypothetical protein PoB_006538500 [Plakobranchus ocellatus]|uniref:Uncharacterized protein n=1 Tax=Plakobranchus ocellatus TaxID=259542 RepID=A0AAV4D4G9_9GAST|nr:hypothetical protein PoB_006538500 [Plakobranchus ocellatus]